MKTLPSGVSHFKTTPVFTQDTVPEGLLNDHTTKAGVWGLIEVQSGTLSYTITGEADSYMLSPGKPGVIEPEVKHHVKPLGDVAFTVSFYK